MANTETITVNGTLYNVLKREDYTHKGASRVCYHAKKAARGRGVFYIIRYENGEFSKPQGITNFGN